MTPWTCTEVENQIELYAAGESDEPARAAIGDHLRRCATCSRAYREAQQLLGLLDTRFQEEDRLSRLRALLEVEDQRLKFRRSPVLPFLRKASALAAMLLVVVGLFQWLGGDRPGRPGGTGGPQFAQGPDPEEWRVPDFNQRRGWPRTVIRESEQARRVGPHPPQETLVKGTDRTTKVQPGKGSKAQERDRSAFPGEVVVQAPAKAEWEKMSEHVVRLSAGELWIRVTPAGVKKAVPVEIRTSQGTAATTDATFWVKVQPGRKGPGAGKPGRAEKPFVGVVVIRGEVLLRNRFGTVTGFAGDKLWAVADKAPQKETGPKR
jgi:hypothetical protein